MQLCGPSGGVWPRLEDCKGTRARLAVKEVYSCQADAPKPNGAGQRPQTSRDSESTLGANGQSRVGGRLGRLGLARQWPCGAGRRADYAHPASLSRAGPRLGRKAAGPLRDRRRAAGAVGSGDLRGTRALARASRSAAPPLAETHCKCHCHSNCSPTRLHHIEAGALPTSELPGPRRRPLSASLLDRLLDHTRPPQRGPPGPPSLQRTLHPPPIRAHAHLSTHKQLRRPLAFLIGPSLLICFRGSRPRPCHDLRQVAFQSDVLPPCHSMGHTPTRRDDLAAREELCTCL